VRSNSIRVPGPVPAAHGWMAKGLVTSHRWPLVRWSLVWLCRVYRPPPRSACIGGFAVLPRYGF
jgi:hypothetical protein